MRRFLRWMLILVLLLLAIGVAVPLFLRSRLHETPSWYPLKMLDAAAQRAASNRAVQSLQAAFSQASAAQAAETQSRLAAKGPQSTGAAADSTAPITLHFSEAELNGFFQNWDQLFGWEAKLGKYFKDPVIVMDGQDLILASKVTTSDLNTLLSLHFEPRMEDGKLRVDLMKVMAGTLPLPQAYYGRYLDKLESSLNEKLPQMRREANISPEGWANRPAVEAAMSELLLHALHDEPAQPVLFLPDMARGSSHALPVRVTQVGIVDKVLTLTITHMDRVQRDELLARLQAEPTQTAMRPTHANTD
jgi:hypothetical protein